MTRRDRLRIMDISTDIHDDPKFRRIQRRRPDHVAPAFLAYLALLGECWQERERLALDEDTWPITITYDPEVIATMIGVGLLTDDRKITESAWAEYVAPALARIAAERERWRRNKADARGRDKAGPTPVRADTTRTPRGVPTESATAGPGRAGPTEPGPGRTNGSRPHERTTEQVPSEGDCRVCGGHVTDKQAARVGPGWIEHAEHPEEWAAPESKT